MWIYEQATGKLYQDDKLVATGYSGKAEGKNNPAMQDVPCIGPIPEGMYTIKKVFNHPYKGPVCMRLVPLRTDTMFGRHGFMIHGDSIKHPGTASEGCIILNREARTIVADSPYRKLLVVKQR